MCAEWFRPQAVAREKRRKTPQPSADLLKSKVSNKDQNRTRRKVTVAPKIQHAPGTKQKITALSTYADEIFHPLLHVPQRCGRCPTASSGGPASGPLVCTADNSNSFTGAAMARTVSGVPVDRPVPFRAVDPCRFLLGAG